jgi:peptidoglycan/xylan/chitin deacetylase (PgdA/CDA1 family)
MNRALVLTYHAVEDGEGPLFVDPATFAEHLDCIVASGARALTVSELADALRERPLTQPTVAVTFDDGIASVARVAAPLLSERGIPATIFCVAGHLGGLSDWPSALPGSPRFELADASELAALAADGFEIGCHGMTHAPLPVATEADAEREVVEAKRLLERRIGVAVRAIAYPYGVAPSEAARRRVSGAFDTAWMTTLGYVTPSANRYELPRVDAHYVRRPRLLRSALRGALSPYLGARRFGAGIRRGLRPDYVGAAATEEGS